MSTRPDSIRRPLLLGLGLLAWLASACGETLPRAPASETKRTLAQGGIIGFVTQDRAHAWRGIPFAAPPVGPLRWRAPQPAGSWDGERQALEFAAPCMQFAGPGGAADGVEEGEPTGSEDCLYLNVFAPPFGPAEVPAGDAALPVMVWIHGGGNSVGDATLYDAGLLATREKLVVVTVQYRLGLFGWFAEPAIHVDGSSAEDRSGNYGTLDLVQSLRWVRDNIAAFGGDPHRVTIFGESSGATNVFSLLLARPARGLFHRAISQSGGARTSTFQAARRRVDDEPPGEAGSSGELAIRYLLHDGRATNRAAAVALRAEMGAAGYRRYLRNKSASELMAVIEGGFGGMYRAPRLFRDGTVLPAEAPAVVFQQVAGYNAVPSILGTNRDEAKLFQLFQSDAVRRVFGIPLWLEDADLYDAETWYPSQMWKARGVDEPAAAMRAAQGPSVFGYRFDWDEEPTLLSADFSRMLGAAHAFEIPFVFGTLSFGAGSRFVFDDEKRGVNEQLSKQMMSYWAQFAYTGDPGRGRRGDQPHWRVWNPAPDSVDKFIVFDVEADGGVRMSGDVATREQIIADVLVDERFTTWGDRCAVLRGFVLIARTMDVEQYTTVADGACRRWPLDDAAG